MGKRIAFIDKSLDNFHANMFHQCIRGLLPQMACEPVAAYALDEQGSRDWAQRKEMQYFDNLTDLNAHVDAFMILAPSNPEVHLELCRKVFPFGKPTYVDKTFAPDLKSARAIYDLADQYNVPVQTSSVLRYTNVQETLKARQAVPRHLIVWGGGSNFNEYAIHPLELALSCMGPHVLRIMRRGSDNLSQILLDFIDGRSAVVNVYVQHDTSFAAMVTTDTATQFMPIDGDLMWTAAMKETLAFLCSGKPLVDRRESLRLMQILDVLKSHETRDQFMDLAPLW